MVKPTEKKKKKKKKKTASRNFRGVLHERHSLYHILYDPPNEGKARRTSSCDAVSGNRGRDKQLRLAFRACDAAPRDNNNTRSLPPPGT